MRSASSSSGVAAVLCVAASAALAGACTMVSGLDEMQKTDGADAAPGPSSKAGGSSGGGGGSTSSSGSVTPADAAPGNSGTSSSGADAAAPSASGSDAGTGCLGPSCDAAADAPPVTQSFQLGTNDCNGGRCRGGYGGTKDTRELATASKQCVDRGFARATDFTIGGEPGGDFCTYVSGQYSCDSSCSGCDEMLTVVCTKP
jgi:hypothetical protein